MYSILYGELTLLRQATLAQLRFQSVRGPPGTNRRWRSKMPESGVTHNLDILGRESWYRYFRFGKEEIAELAAVLDLSLVIHGETGICEPRNSAPAIFLARLTSTGKLAAPHLQFGWQPKRIFMIS